MIQASHKDQSKDQSKGHSLNHKALIYFDDELKVPIWYESYDFPVKEGGKPALLEEYTYLNVKMNNGFTDKDFDLFRTPRSPPKVYGIPPKESGSPGRRRCRPAVFPLNRWR